MPSFEVQGPDGRKFQVDTPEGATQDDAIDEVARIHYGQKSSDSGSGYKDAQGRDLDPLTGKPVTGQMHYMDTNGPLLRTMAGVGAGMQNFGRGAGNMIGLGHVFPSVFGDQHIKDEAELNRPITDTPEGQAGVLAGNVVAGLPLSELAGAASIAARGVPLAGRVLGSTLARAGVEGGLNSAILADPDERESAALEGAGLGMFLNRTLGGAGRIVRGLLQKSDATQDLEQIASQHGKDLFIPASMASGDEGDVVTRLAKSAYRSVLPLFPGVSTQMERQASQARGVVQDIALSEADPLGTIVKAGSGKEGTRAVGQLKDAFDNLYNTTVGGYSFNVPPDLDAQIEARVRAAMPNVDATTMGKTIGRMTGQVGRYSSQGPSIDGMNLLNAKRAIESTLENMKAGPEKDALTVAHQWFDDHIEQELQAGMKKSNLADLQKYQQLEEPMQNFRQVQQATQAAKATGGNFTMPQAAQAADPTGTMAHIAQTGNEVLGKTAVQPNTEGKFLAYGAGLYSAFAHGGGPALAALAGANLLATKTAQRFVMGDTVAQRAIAKLIQNNPEMATKVGQMIRLGGTAMAGNANAGPNQ